MIVSHAHEFIFLKTRKAAGTSIEIALSEFCGPDDIITAILPEDEKLRQELGFRGPQNHRGAVRFRHHDTAAYVRSHLGDDVWDRYFKFSVERDPFDKAISRYYWSTPTVNRPPIEAYLESVDEGLLSSWSIYTIDDEIAVDLMVRYEQLRSDLALATRRIGLPELRLPHAKGDHRTDRRHYSQVLSPRSRATLERICARECEEFSYRWTDEPATT